MALEAKAPAPGAPGPEQIKNPGLINQLIPYIITAAIFIYLYLTIDFKKMFQLLEGASLAWFIPATVLMTVVFALVDSFSFGQAYSWFNAKLTAFEKIELRTAPYVIQVTLAPLAEVLFPIYLWRRKGISPAHAVSSSIWTLVNDFAAVFTALTLAVIYNLKTGLVPAIGIPWLVVMIVFWVVYLGNLVFWHSPLQPKVAGWIERSQQTGVTRKGFRRMVLLVAGTLIQLLRTFSIARWHHYLWVYFVRLFIVVAAVISNYAALRALGLHPPLPLVLIATPIIFYAHFLPINVGGYGGPQALAILFFYEIGKCGSKEQVAAYSFLWSTGFLVGRFLFGAAFIRGFMKKTFPEGFRNWRRQNQ
jgi:hypothetical protein